MVDTTIFTIQQNVLLLLESSLWEYNLTIAAQFTHFFPKSNKTYTNEMQKNVMCQKQKDWIWQVLALEQVHKIQFIIHWQPLTSIGIPVMCDGKQWKIKIPNSSSVNNLP